MPVQNPSSDVLRVKYFVNDLNQKHVFSLYSVSGELIYQEQLKNETGIISIEKDLSAGVYFANIDGFKSIKFIKE